eukprot:COSAG04_NODE_12064_length_673_cov_0.554007_1_plen_178_part_10
MSDRKVNVGVKGKTPTLVGIVPVDMLPEPGPQPEQIEMTGTQLAKLESLLEPGRDDAAAAFLASARTEPAGQLAITAQQLATLMSLLAPGRDDAAAAFLAQFGPADGPEPQESRQLAITALQLAGLRSLLQPGRDDAAAAFLDAATLATEQADEPEPEPEPEPQTDGTLPSEPEPQTD